MTHIISGFDIALPPELFRIDIKMPPLPMLSYGREHLPSILAVQVLCNDAPGLVWGAGSRGTGDEDVALDGSGEHPKEGVVDVFAYDG